MLAIRDNLGQCLSALHAHKLRASLTMLGLTMGVATLITVMTIVQGANAYVYKKIEPEDVRAVEEACTACAEVGATASASVKARYEDKESTDVNFYGQTPNMANIDSRTVELGRYFSNWESEHRTYVCLIGDTIVQRLFLGVDPIGKSVRIGNDEFTVIGVMEKIGSVLGQDQDNFVIVPLPVFLEILGSHTTSLTINVKT